MPLGSLHVFGSLERDIMLVLWQRGASSIRDVHTELFKARGIAYTTVMTSIDRLTDKHILSRGPKGARGGYIYTPNFTRESLMRLAVQAVLEELEANDEERQRIAAGLVNKG